MLYALIQGILIPLNADLNQAVLIKSNDNLKKITDDLFQILQQINLDICKSNSTIINFSIFQPAHNLSAELSGDDLFDKELLEKLRTRLYSLTQPHLVGLINETILEKINNGLMTLARINPINDATLITLEPLDTIPADRIIFTTTGHLFDLLEAKAFYKHNKWINPYNNEPFTPFDISHIINTCIQYNKVNHDIDLAQFLKSLGSPTCVMNKNQLLFEVNELGEPLGLLNFSLSQFDIPRDKVKLILSQKNIMLALYEHLISLNDIDDIDVSNLKILNMFSKALNILRGPQSASFIEQLKTRPETYIFSTINNNASEPENTSCSIF